MKKDDANPSALIDQAQDRPAPDTPRLSERLTEAEIEVLRQNQKEAIEYAQKKYFPNARIHRVKGNLPERSAGEEAEYHDD